MEAARERKDREFRRIQRNLMQLLYEQKMELVSDLFISSHRRVKPAHPPCLVNLCVGFHAQDSLREKGIELETATATTAAAATATAQKAKEHEKRAAAMFQQTEELLKFQFMSMSLSYFSSLNMLKQMREINSDTTAAAVSSSADAAAAAAAASAAANLPSLKHFNLGAQDFLDASVQQKQQQLLQAKRAEEAIVRVKEHTLPTDVQFWTVGDVSQWLETLSLGQYSRAFQEACIDGAFLMELREEDLMQVLGIEHKLHVRKIMLSREKLRPLTKAEQAKKQAVLHEESSAQVRSTVGVPDLETVFSQARHGRIKRLEESLNLGFPVDSEDSKGNTLLIVAAQNLNKRMMEILLARGANVNHQNAQGNTALHFAMAYDTSGLLGELSLSLHLDSR